MIISRVQRVILSYDCTLSQISEVSGVSLGCLKHLLYGAGAASSSDERVAYNQGAAPRYDRVIRLLAGRYIPLDTLLADGLPSEDLIKGLIAFCATPIQLASKRMLETRTFSAREYRYLPSRKRIRAVADGKIPQLDVVVRLLKAGTITLDDLTPPVSATDSDGVTKSLLPAGLTEENTRDFFAALRGIFTLE